MKNLPMDKHLLATNPLTDNGHKAIIRTVKPVSVFEIIPGYKELPGKPYKRYYNESGDEFTLLCTHIDPSVVTIEDLRTIYKYMDDAWYYFKAYKAKYPNETI